ncbi:MAG: subfamily B ATP-binding cassette protein MsbA, partial [Gammaproteobacteria bacterium]
VIAFLYLFKNLFRYLAMVCMANIRHGVAADLRKSIYEKITQLPLRFFSQEKKGDIMARSTADVVEIELSIIGSLEMIFRDPLGVILTLGTLFFISPNLTLFSLILMPISALIIGSVGKSLRRTSLKGQNKSGELLAYLEESLGGIRIIKGFGAEDFVQSRFEALNNRLKSININMLNKKDIASPLSEFLGALVLVLIVWFGGSLILDGENGGLQASEFITFIILFSQVLRPIQNISKAWTNVNKGLASMDRVNKILHAENPIKESEPAIAKKEFSAQLTFDNVSFSYDEKPLLQDINLNLKKGQTVALVGESGGGKSTLMDLVTRFYDINNGSILIDGDDIRNIKIDDLRGLFGIVSQKAILFNDSIFNNIAFGSPESTLEDVKFAAKVANADQFISKMENGYESMVGDGGDTLSGGQKQRISIARAILKNPPILLLDEATSALDTESEKLVQDALNSLLKNRTSLVIAHRLSTIQSADEILVLQEGKITERGKHDELISQDGVYSKLIKMQNL